MIIWHCARFVFYSLVLIVLLLWWPDLVQQAGLPAFLENGPVELAQLGLLVLIVAVLTFAYRRSEHGKGLLALLLMLFLWCLVRENDALFDRLLPRGGWQAVSIVPLGIGAWLAYRARASFRIGWELVRGRGAGIVWAGLMILAPIAQSVGHRPLLLLMFADQYSQEAKQALEETLEMCGYFVCLAGAIELAMEEAQVRRAPAAASAPSPVPGE